MFGHQVHHWIHHSFYSIQKHFPDQRGIHLTTTLFAPGDGIWSKWFKNKKEPTKVEKDPKLMTREELKEESLKTAADEEEFEELRNINCPKGPNPGGKPKPLIQPADVFKLEIPDYIDPACDFPKVVIVGAGIAGLSAAEYLCSKHCFNSVTVLEAKDRPGGRIYSCLMDKTPVELGAQYVYGSSISNPIMPLVARDPDSANNYIVHSDMPEGLFSTGDGHIIRESIVSKVQIMFKELVEQAKNIYRKPSNEYYPSLKAFVDNFLDTQIPVHFRLLERSEAIKAINSMIVSLENELGTELSNVNAQFFGARVDTPGSKISFKKGFSNVVKRLVKRMGGCCLKLKTPVEIIKWDTNDVRAKVVTCNGDEYPADYIIVTVSLGVLKTQPNLFYPQLPAEKLDVIERMGFGHINKIFLQYDKAFWVNCMPQIKPHVACDDDNWIEYIGLIDEAPVDGSNVLVATVGGRGAKMTECLDECQIACKLTRLLRCVLGDQTVPTPKTILRSKWSSDAHFCGASSYISTRSNIGDISKLADPVPLETSDGAPIIFFAGEATSPYYFGTVHGARQSGIREAQRIAHLTKLFCGQPPKIFKKTCEMEN